MMTNLSYFVTLFVSFIHSFFFSSYFLSFFLNLYLLFSTSLIQLGILFSLFSICLVTLLAFIRADNFSFFFSFSGFAFFFFSLNFSFIFSLSAYLILFCVERVELDSRCSNDWRRGN
jgi:hypothetical protein